MFKKLSILLILSIILNMGIAAFAQENWNYLKSNDLYGIEEEYVKLFLGKINHPSEVHNPTFLYNPNRDLECISFEIKTGGYIIVNINDLSIVEFSFEKVSPFKKGKEYIYNGALSYLEYSEENFDKLKNVEYKYHKEKTDKAKK